jgi:16S rRNA G966 N2-methylase RsmD
MCSYTADRMAQLLAAVARQGLVTARSEQQATDCGDMLTRLTAIDLTACCGGTTLALARHFTHVTACELDAARYKHLCHNVTVCSASSSVRCLHIDSTTLLSATANSGNSERFDVACLDPPWGGVDYSSADCAGELLLGSISLSNACLALAERCDVVACEVPRNYDADAWARAMVEPQRTGAGGWLSAVSSDGSSSSSSSVRAETAAAAAAAVTERPLPFRLHMGGTRLLIVCFPSTHASAVAAATVSSSSSSSNSSSSKNSSRRRLVYNNAALDSVIAAVRAWNKQYGSEHQPAFFDWEADRWIDLRRWRGCKLM